jgi:phospholipid transport system substrate-binding protein
VIERLVQTILALLLASACLAPVSMAVVAESAASAGPTEPAGAADPALAAGPAPPAGAAELAPTADAADPAGAPAVIARFNEMLLEVMRRADELGYQGRFEMVAAHVDDTFDMTFMASKSIGRHWRKLDDEQKARWVQTFNDFTVSSYADKFDGYSGQTIEVVGEKPASHGTLVILTRLTRTDDDPVDLDYRMRDGEDGWRVVDIYSDGKVSEVALRRSEYAVVLKEGGIDTLIEAVTRKTAKRAAKHS